MGYLATVPFALSGLILMMFFIAVVFSGIAIGGQKIFFRLFGALRGLDGGVEGGIIGFFGAMGIL